MVGPENSRHFINQLALKLKITFITSWFCHWSYIRIYSPSDFFVISCLQAGLEMMSTGHMLADVVAIIGKRYTRFFLYFFYFLFHLLA